MRRLRQLAAPLHAASYASTPIPYQGFEQGPTRPPTERFSLKLRVSRNCPWNQCTFCPLYKKERFSLRSVEDVKRDIDCVAKYVRLHNDAGDELRGTIPDSERLAAEAARDWVRQGLQDVFLQDANTLLMPPADLLRVLRYLRETFPSVRRVTSYARSHTIARLPDDALRELRDAGLDRIHVGLESGSDAVLRRVRKGATQAIHIKAGQKVRAAGMELSVYYMPGLGGQDLSEEHAVQSAHTINQIDPHFIRVRSLFLTPDMQLFREMQAGLFRPLSEEGKVRELRTFVDRLGGVTSELKSNDHFLNLLAEVDGRLPTDKPRILRAIAAFQSLPPPERALFTVGKRAALFRTLADLESAALRPPAEALVAALGVSPATVDLASQHLLGYFERTLFRGGSFRYTEDVLHSVRATMLAEQLGIQSVVSTVGGDAGRAQCANA